MARKQYVVGTKARVDGEIREFGDVVSAESIDDLFDQLKEMYRDSECVKEFTVKLSA